MSRTLAELLGARELDFRAQVAELERANGAPSIDLGLQSEVSQTVQRTLRTLGLDPHDTTAAELYGNLQSRLQQDDQRLSRALHISSTDSDVMSKIGRVLADLRMPQHSLALKPAVVKKLLKQQPPRGTMKLLGYRSLDSLLKHEPVAAVLGAAWLVEPPRWQKAMHQAYGKLQAIDFELRPSTVLALTAERWQNVSTAIGTKRIITQNESATLLLLPFAASLPPAAVLTTLVTALHAFNELRAASTYLKLHQVRPDFGQSLQQLISGQANLDLVLFDQPLSWQLIQRYYARFSDDYRQQVFEPHIQADDFVWHAVEHVLSEVEPELDFWHGTAHAGLLQDGEAVSCNILDVAVGYCNQLPFAQRSLQHFRRSLWYELLLRYVKHEHVEQAVLQHIQTELATEPVLI